MFETPAETVLGKVCKGERLTREEWRTLVDFIYAQYVRTPSFFKKVMGIQYNAIENSLEKIGKEISKGIIQEHGRTNRINHADYKTDMLPIEVSKKDEEIKEGKDIYEVEVVAGKSSVLMSVYNLLLADNNVRKFFHNLKWSVVEIDSSINLPTTDNPVTLVRVIENKRLQVVSSIYRDGFVIMPISPKRFLLGSYKRNNRWSFCADLSFSMEVKRAIVNGAYLYVYSNIEDVDIPIIRPRLVSKEGYERVIKEQRLWHEYYIEKEVPMLQRRAEYQRSNKQ